MFQTVFDTAALLRPHRLAGFDDLQATSDHPMRALSTESDRFTARVESMDFASVNVVQLSCSGASIVRTERQVRDFDPELCAIVLPLEGRLVVEQARGRADIDHGALALYTSARPFRVHIGASRRGARLLRVHVPRSLVQLLSPRLERLEAQAVPVDRGVGALLADFLRQLYAESPSYAEADLPRLANLVVDLLTAALADRLNETGPSAVAESTLMPRIIGFITEHLDHPELSPPAIAEAHHISVSHLHRLFRAYDTTVGRVIRAQRLERARHDLGDPHLRTVPIYRIASRWGFRDHATFTRAFRAAFGVAPREYRLAATGTDAARGSQAPYDVVALMTSVG